MQQSALKTAEATAPAPTLFGKPPTRTRSEPDSWEYELADGGVVVELYADGAWEIRLQGRSGSPDVLCGLELSADRSAVEVERLLRLAASAVSA